MWTNGSGNALLARALRLVRFQVFAFVGLVEDWDASICLLHASLGRGTQPIEADLAVGPLAQLGGAAPGRWRPRVPASVGRRRLL